MVERGAWSVCFLTMAAGDPDMAHNMIRKATAAAKRLIQPLFMSPSF
jgi:hypothetical protein